MISGFTLLASLARRTKAPARSEPQPMAVRPRTSTVRRASFSCELKTKCQGNNRRGSAYYEMEAKTRRTQGNPQDRKSHPCAKASREDECSPVRQFDSFSLTPPSALPPY